MNSAEEELAGVAGLWPADEAARQVRLAAISAVLLLLGLCAFTIDLPVKQFFQKTPPQPAVADRQASPPANAPWRIPGDLRGFLNLCEVFAHGLGVAMIGWTVWVLDPAGRKHVPRIVLGAYLGGLLAVSIKLLIARTRPEYFAGSEVTETFTGWLPGFSSPTKEQSFPSGHAATAAAFAAALAWRYPQGFGLFALLAALAGMQRLAEGAHFLSDVLIGGGLGLAFAAVWLPAGGLSRGLRPLEAFWEPSSAEIAPSAETTRDEPR